jgi:hypothetical protein
MPDASQRPLPHSIRPPVGVLRGCGTSLAPGSEDIAACVLLNNPRRGTRAALRRIAFEPCAPSKEKPRCEHHG